MTNTELLLLIIKDSGLKKSYIASALGITTYSLSQKIKNIRQFKAREIYTLSRMLGINTSEILDAIFFTTDVEFSSTSD